jgi:hypothetical protein
MKLPVALKVCLAIVCLALVVAAVATYWLYLEPYHGYVPLRFDPERWAAADPETRGRMLDDLLARYELKGMSRREVEELLGPPPYPVGYRGFNPRAAFVFPYTFHVRYGKDDRVTDHHCDD